MGNPPTWKVSSREVSFRWEGALTAYWQVEFDSISDDYTPEEITAKALFSKWTERIRSKFPNELIPIHWFVECTSQGQFEYMPFQFNHFSEEPPEDFLRHFSWPLNSETGHPLNWLSLPVRDKLWNNKTADKGGFIQEFTGWKPSILQPYVFLPTLTRSRQLVIEVGNG